MPDLTRPYATEANVEMLAGNRSKARILLRDNARATVLEVRRNWKYERQYDGTMLVTIFELPPVTRALMQRVFDFVLFIPSTPPQTWGNGQVIPWTDPGDRRWLLKNFYVTGAYAA